MNRVKNLILGTVLFGSLFAGGCVSIPIPLPFPTNLGNMRWILAILQEDIFS